MQIQARPMGHFFRPGTFPQSNRPPVAMPIGRLFRRPGLAGLGGPFDTTGVDFTPPAYSIDDRPAVLMETPQFAPGTVTDSNTAGSASSFNWQELLKTAGNLAVQYGTAKLQQQTVQKQYELQAKLAQQQAATAGGQFPGVPGFPGMSSQYGGANSPVYSNGGESQLDKYMPFILGGAGLLAILLITK